jgi:hypothetical protein
VSVLRLQSILFRGVKLARWQCHDLQNNALVHALRESAMWADGGTAASKIRTVGREVHLDLYQTQVLENSFSLPAILNSSSVTSLIACRTAALAKRLRVKRAELGQS